MSLAIVTNQLQQMAAASAVKAARANDPDSIAALKQAEELFRRLSALVQGGIVELDAYRKLAATKAPKRRGRAGIDALEFWRRHGMAVASIRAAYGDNWTIKAPFGETELVAMPPCWRSFKTERGTTLTWRRDNRIPAAKYWPDQRLPEGLTITADYLRATGEEEAHDDAWHLAHGYVLSLGMWVSELGLRASEVHQETIEANRLRAEQAKIDQAAAEDAEVEVPLAEAAD
jgi:hypothetical protein